MLLNLIRRELLVARRNWVALAIPLFFFVMVVSLFPFAVSSDAADLQKIAPGIIWVSALLATLLSLEQFYRSDYQDGSLEQMVIMTNPTLLAASKIIAHWLLTGLPLVVISPILGILMQLNYLPTGLAETAQINHNSALVLSLLLGTPTLCLIGAVGMSLTLAANRNGMLVAILILPLYVPVLIFGASVVTASLENFSYNGQLAVLGALLLLAILVMPFAAGRALKIAVS